jgi:hypothetical protein
MKSLSYEYKWKKLSDLLIKTQKMGEKIPSKVMNDLRSAKTIIQVLKRDPTHIESLARVEVYLKNVEAYVISIAEKNGSEMVQEWLKKINQSETKCKKSPDSTVSPKVSQDEKWIRIKQIKEIPLENVEKMSEKLGLSVKVEENGDIIIVGDEKGVKSFVKSMAKQFEASRKG